MSETRKRRDARDYGPNPWRTARHVFVRTAYEAISPFFRIAIRLYPEDPDQAFDDAVCAARDAGFLDGLLSWASEPATKEMIFADTPELAGRRCAPASEAIH